MRTYSEQYNILYGQIQQRLYKLIKWKGEPSKFVNERCLDISEYNTGYIELTYLNDRFILLDMHGQHYNLDNIEFLRLCYITDKVSIFNPRDNKEYPLRSLADSGIKLSDFPNFHKSGSISGMKKLYYGKACLLVRFGDYIYNVTSEPEIYFEHTSKF